MSEKNRPIISEEEGLMYLARETQELQREADRLDARIDVIKCYAMERALEKLSKEKT